MKGKTITTTLFLGIHMALLAAPSGAAPGDLDPTFGTEGMVTTGFSEGWDEAAHGVALHADGLVAVGYAVGYNGLDFALTRYTRQGTLDQSFGAGGRVTTDFWNDDVFGVGSTGGDVAYDVAVQPDDGKIVVVGSTYSWWQSHIVVARYLPSGALDPTFGQGGTVITDPPALGFKMTHAFAVALQPEDGKIVVAGRAGDVSETCWDWWEYLHPFPPPLIGPPCDDLHLVPAIGDFFVARYLPNGLLDPSFGGTGVVVVDFSEGEDWATSVLVQPDGKIVAGGTACTSIEDGFCPRQAALARFTTIGSLDPTFGSAGKLTTHIGGAGEIAIQTVHGDARLIVVGREGNDFALARYNLNGGLDTSFGANGTGTVTTDLGGDDWASSVTVTDRIVVAGSTARLGNWDFALTRYNADGILDTTFGGGMGTVTTDFGGSELATDVAVQPDDGGIVLAGQTSLGGGDFALARYQAAGPPPTVPEAPSLTATAGNATVRLEWTTPADGGSPISAYRVYRGTASGTKTLLTTVGKVNSFDDNTVTNGTPYFYEVSAVNGVGEGAPSVEVSTTPATVPAAPSLSAASGKPKGVALSWTTPANGGSAISGYRIYRGTTSGGTTFMKAVGTDTTYKDRATAKGTTYYYVVRAFNAVGEGPPSNEADARAR